MHPSWACRSRAPNSRRRLRTEQIDLYLLHWRGKVPLEETVAGFMALQDAGVIRYWGVSNFDTGDMEELWSVRGGSDAVTDQVLYNLMRRGIEWNLYHWLRQHRLPVMAYSPFDQAGLLHDQRLIGSARANDMTPAQVALAWLISHDDVIAIPRTGSRHRLQENARVLGCPSKARPTRGAQCAVPGALASDPPRDAVT